MHNFFAYEWLTIFTILGLLAIVVVKYLNALRFNHFMWVISNSKYLKIYIRGLRFIDAFNSLLFFNFSISASIFLYFGYSTYITPITFSLVPFLCLLLILSFIIILKLFFERTIGNIFEIKGLIDSYLFQKISFINYSGFILCIANVLLLFTELNPKIIIIATIILIILIFSIGFITSFKTYQKIIIPNLFYFLLYLCALEFAPYILLYMVFREYKV